MNILEDKSFILLLTIIVCGVWFAWKESRKDYENIKNGKLVKVGQTVNSTQIKTARILWLENNKKYKIWKGTQ